MPVSKRRKPKRQLPPNAMHKNEATAHFRQLAQMDGEVFPAKDRTYTPEGENPFTTAWTRSKASTDQYAEGVVWREDTGWIAHAWCVSTDGAVIEVTDGYGDAKNYKGWILDPKDAELMNGGPEAPTASVLTSGLMRGGGQYTSLMGRITKRENAPVS